MGISAAVGNVGIIPTGAVMPFAGITSPSGWLLCGGQLVSRTEYAGLFSIIGTTYGVGDGSTTFAIPDLRGRVVAGVDNMGGTTASRLTSTTITGGGDAVGEVGGAQTHTLTTTEMPSHTHTQNSHNHTQNSHNHSQNAHAHSFTPRYGGTTFVGVTMDINGSGNPYGLGGGYVEGATATNIATTATNIETTATNQNTGGDGAHNNVQPTIVLNYIIKASN